MALRLFNDADHLTVLAVRMKKGERKAAAKLYDELFPKTYGFFFSRTSKREVAEDLSQDMFLKLIEKIENFDEKRGAFVVWFWQVARNMLVDHYRKKNEAPFSSFADEEVESMAVAPPSNIEARMDYRKLQGLLASLSEDEKELFELRYVAEVPYKEIATILGKSEGSLRVAALRIKEKLKKNFDHEI